MFRKYYTFNVINANGISIGSRVIRLGFWHSPLSAMTFALSGISDDKSVVNFKRIR